MFLAKQKGTYHSCTSNHTHKHVKWKPFVQAEKSSLSLLHTQGEHIQFEAPCYIIIAGKYKHTHSHGKL